MPWSPSYKTAAPTTAQAAAPVKPSRAKLPAARTGLGRALLGCVTTLGLLGLLSCSSAPVSTQNPSTLWVSFGQSELDLVLVESEPPYY